LWAPSVIVRTTEGATGGAARLGATGNVATEDVVHMLHEMGVETGIDLKSLIDCANRMSEILGKELPGQVMKAGPRSVRHAA
jgi:hydroxymethylglutaryl-CoA lyase